jgi:hypothetical protein
VRWVCDDEIVRWVEWEGAGAAAKQSMGVVFFMHIIPRWSLVLASGAVVYPNCLKMKYASCHQCCCITCIHRQTGICKCIQPSVRGSWKSYVHCLLVPWTSTYCIPVYSSERAKSQHLPRKTSAMICKAKKGQNNENKINNKVENCLSEIETEIEMPADPTWPDVRRSMSVCAHWQSRRVCWETSPIDPRDRCWGGGGIAGRCELHRGLW